MNGISIDIKKWSFLAIKDFLFGTQIGSLEFSKLTIKKLLKVEQREG